MSKRHFVSGLQNQSSNATGAGVLACGLHLGLYLNNSRQPERLKGMSYISQQPALKAYDFQMALMRLLQHFGVPH